MHFHIMSGQLLSGAFAEAGTASQRPRLNAASQRLSALTESGQPAGPAMIHEPVFPEAVALHFASAEEAGMLDTECAGLADRAEIQFAYAIGHPQPVSIHIDTFGTHKVNEENIEKAVKSIFSFKPADIVTQLNLLRPIYSKTTNYGHFGKEDKEITWEKTDKAAALKKAAR
jgi:hypothetical protein